MSIAEMKKQKLKGKYSAKSEKGELINMAFVIKLWSKGLITSAEYDDINGFYGWFEEDMSFVEKLLRKKIANIGDL